MDFISNNLDTIITVITAIVIPFIGFLVFKLFRRPRLEIEINFNSGSRRRGQAINYPHKSDEIPYAEDLTYNYNFRQDFNIVALNNSEIDAYDIQLQINELDNAEFHVNGKTNFSPLPAHEEFEIPCRFSKTIEAGYRNPPNINELREQIRDEVKITTSAKNKFRFKRFYSNYSNGENTFSFIRW